MIRAVLKHVARTQNMSALARDTGLNRGNLYEALSEDGNPTLETLLKITRALGLRLHLEPQEIVCGDGIKLARTSQLRLHLRTASKRLCGDRATTTGQRSVSTSSIAFASFGQMRVQTT